jgi:hypothetical protein
MMEVLHDLVWSGLRAVAGASVQVESLDDEGA